MFNKLIKKESWMPVDGFVLEPSAMEVVKSDTNTLVIAGPGAGKTELLAQRACFLLQTNTCTYPKKILAISFKKDAAKNLQERVEKRCGKELASRFESKTYDAFAKEILDRFYKVLPGEYIPKLSYDIAELSDVRNAFEKSGLSRSVRNINRINNQLSNRLVNNRLPIEKIEDNEILIKSWYFLLKGLDDKSNSKLTFNMISRLAEYIIRLNNNLKYALQMTYSHVFLDEFQDTTNIQYELIKTCFLNSNTIFTAVGDNKQRIMLWAGALTEIFKKYHHEFNANEYKLLMNHRSAPRLVQFQKMMYQSLNEVDLNIKHSDKWGAEQGEAYLRLFDNNESEAVILADEIYKLQQNGLALSDICILVKQTPDNYGKEIIKELSKKSIKARNEAIFQDFLKEEIITLLINFMYLVIKERAPDEWTYINLFLTHLNGIESYSDVNKIQEIHNTITNVVDEFQKNLLNINYENLIQQINKILDSVNKEKIIALYTKYNNKEYFNDLVDKFINYLWAEFNETNNWLLALENLEGKHSVPIMTIHKSKGLEYDTIFFVGLEDGAFWNFSNQPEEDRCAFFVALSRAKRRIDFTYCRTRNNRDQTRDVINEFYELINKSDIIKEVNYE